MKPVRTLIVDDSAVVRRALSALLSGDPGVEVMAAVPDPIFAKQRLLSAWPDVILLDVEMPRMDGITFLREIMSRRPTPVIICSTLTTRGARTTMEALAAGAFAVVAKPSLVTREHFEANAAEFLRLVKQASHARVGNLVPAAAPAPAPLLAPAPLAETTEHVVAIGTSTGGTVALERVLSALPRVCPGIVIVQHMPEKFTAAFAQRLDGICEIHVREAADNDRVLPGQALIAPGGRHMQLRRSGAQYHVSVRDGPAVNRHKPSVDVLFRSVAQEAGANAVGVIMTGMGDDGAVGLEKMHAAGARTFAQDEASCVVFGMPREAIKRGAVDKVLPLDGIAGAILYAPAGSRAQQSRG